MGERLKASQIAGGSALRGSTDQGVRYRSMTGENLGGRPENSALR
jgi:hypothetical protein